MLVYEDILLSIDTKNSAGTVAFNLANTCYSKDFPKGNCRHAWNCFHSKFEPNTSQSLLKLCKIFARQRKDDVGLMGRVNDVNS